MASKPQTHTIERDGYRAVFTMRRSQVDCDVFKVGGDIEHAVIELAYPKMGQASLEDLADAFASEAFMLAKREAGEE